VNRDEFCKYHWEYYLVLEKDFLETERYISFDLGDNYLYDDRETTNIGNSMTFSNEYIKQYHIKDVVNIVAILSGMSNLTQVKQNIDCMKDFQPLSLI